MSDKNTSPVMARVIGIAYMAAILIIASSVSTQFMAVRFAYHPSLGQPLFWKLYNPFDWWPWVVKFYGSSPTTCNYAFGIFALGFFIAILVARLTVGFKSRSSRKHEGTHGTAHFATREEVMESGLIPRDQTAIAKLFGGEPPIREGVYCGGFYDDDTETIRYLRHSGPEHVCVIAPTGSGKGVTLVIPTLLSWLESVFVLDIKGGENYAMSAGWRKRDTNSIVLRYDPANDNNNCAWNAIGEVRFCTRYQISDAQNVALMVVDDDGKGLYDHWRKGAFELLGGLIMHAIYKSMKIDREPCLTDCANMLTSTGDFAVSGGGLVELFEEMSTVSLDSDNISDREAELYIRGVGRSMSGKPEKERDSIVSTASLALALYRDPVIGRNTSRSDFKVADLMDHEKPVSLYFITTPDNLIRLRPLIRLLLTRMIAGLTGQMEFDKGRSKTKHKHKLLLMLDEFPSLGRLDMFESALAFIRGYGIKAYIITQDIQQLYQSYTQYQSITSNCHIRIAFAPTELKTAEMLSKMTGITTVVTEQISTSGKRFGMTAGQFSSSFHSSQRALMTPDEIQSLPMTREDGNGDLIPGELLTFVAGHSVIKGRQTPYFLDPTFSKRSRIPPPETSDVVRKTEQSQSGFALQ